ncbi:MAG: 3-phosphoshikimate 1-carboxyvinyltransferase [Desulfovibrionaceae bacterium]|nr:3-phosphoshikimate 1-carboxyvinyltransferase [Desulfovibrionaceae bacterium]
MITVQAPSSKSVSHRMLIAAALSPGQSLLRGLLECDDLDRTEGILQAAGAVIDREGDGVRRVTGLKNGPVGGSDDQSVSCFAGESGTTCRIMSAVLAAGKGNFYIHGVPRLHERPLGALLEALHALGARIKCQELAGHAPFCLKASGLNGGKITLALDESSQYLSGLLLAAPLCRTALQITVGGTKVVSWPYVGLTLETLAEFEISFHTERLEDGSWKQEDWRLIRKVRPYELRVTVKPSVYVAGERMVEGDWSGASYLLAAGVVGSSAVKVQGLRETSVQGDRAIVELLQSMGATVSFCADGIVTEPSDLHGIDVDMGDCPDLVPTVAALAVFARGTTRIRGVAHLRLKESDRIAAPAQELRKMGIDVQEYEDGLAVRGIGHAPNPDGIVFHAHNDHRIAMSLALFGLQAAHAPERLGAVELDHPEVVRKSFPDFWKVWRHLACPSEK